LKVLVTGGNGFLGGYVCERLEALGHNVALFDRAGRVGDMDREGREFYLGDVRDHTAVFESVYHSDGVIHLAGVLGTQETFADPIPAIETNILGSMNVFKACELYKKKCVYIAVGNHWMNNPYSITKTTAERFALMLNKERGTQIAIVRGLNAYGPRQKAVPVRKIMPNFIIPALQNKPITVYGDGSQVMDMIYVSDLADILSRALLVEHGVYDRVFEAGTGRPTTVLQIAEEVIRQTESTGSIRRVAMRPGEPDRSEVLGNPETLAPLYKSLRVPMVTLEDGIAQTIDYYRRTFQQEKSSEVFA
jgi:nucleoside-diphosphate-sugar epimerase